MNVKEIASALGKTEDQVIKAIEGMGAINPSMLDEIRQKIEGGKLAVGKTAPVAKSERKGSAAKAVAKAEKEAAALAKVSESATLATKNVIAESSSPAVLDEIDKAAQPLDVVSTIQNQKAQQIVEDVQSLASLMTPQVVALKTVQGAQALSVRMGEALDAQGLTIDAIIAAATPRSTRTAFDDLLAAALGSIEV